MKLPPYGKKFDPVPNSGVRVAIGPGAWDFARSHAHPIMVLPEDCTPADFRWPSDGRPALVHERGEYNDERLDEIAAALLRAGASSVVALREALVNDSDPRVFYDREVINVAS